MRQRVLNSLCLAVGATVIAAVSSLACSSTETDTPAAGTDGGTGSSTDAAAGTSDASQSTGAGDGGTSTGASDSGATHDAGGGTTGACSPVVAPKSTCAATKVSYGVPVRLQWPSNGNFNVDGVLVHDMNNDGRADIEVQESPNGVDVYLSHGDGTFAMPVHYAADIEGNDSFAAGDFDGDCIVDILTTNAGGSLSYFKGNGDGTLASEAQTPGPGTGLAMIAGDLNKDGKLDFIVQGGSDAIVGLNEGTFTFTTNNAPWGDDNSPGGYTDGIDLGDLDGNGSADLVFGAAVVDGTGFACFLPNAGNGTFGAAKCSTMAPGVNAKKPAVADYNGDGKLDIAVKTDQTDGVSVFLGNGDGTFKARADYALVGERAFRAADVNNDGKPDLAAYDAPNSVINVLLNNGDGTFASTPMALPGGGPSSNTDEPMAVGDVLGNGLTAFAVNDRANGSVDVVIPTCEP